jgi:transposase-like protein
MLGVLAAYIKREATVVRICAVYGVAVSTLYRWKGRLLTHKALFLGYLFSKGGPLISFIDGLVRASADLSKRLDGFFRTHGFSFMQNNKGATPQSAPP